MPSWPACCALCRRDLPPTPGVKACPLAQGAVPCASALFADPHAEKVGYCLNSLKEGKTHGTAQIYLMLRYRLHLGQPAFELVQRCRSAESQELGPCRKYTSPPILRIQDADQVAQLYAFIYPNLVKKGSRTSTSDTEECPDFLETRSTKPRGESQKAKQEVQSFTAAVLGNGGPGALGDLAHRTGRRRRDLGGSVSGRGRGAGQEPGAERWAQWCRGA